MTDAQDEVFCEREQKHFPRSDFEVDARWGLVHKVHPRHTKEGTIVNRERDVPEPTEAPSDEEL